MYIIITLRSLLWIIISLLASVLMVSALLSPYWLIGPSQVVVVDRSENLTYTPSLGVYAECERPVKGSKHPHCVLLAAEGLATDPIIFPNILKASTVFLAIGLVIMAVTVVTSFISCCFQSICRKSIFTVSGATQVIAGMFYIMGIMLYPMGWGIIRVQEVCGKSSSPFYPGDCSMGGGLYKAVLSTILTFVSACISLYAEKSTSSDKVQDHISRGKTVVCLP